VRRYNWTNIVDGDFHKYQKTNNVERTSKIREIDQYDGRSFMTCAAFKENKAAAMTAAVMMMIRIKFFNDYP
jgi:hypothetical protein